ncbi:tripartite motif-containing protein 66-like isoform X2 [Amblyraja radiata]|uniref:tripartite motif-containing protein 66-like isoform X2 n=1 Tax=Amblyraja radiata TaxID=386614 RepID=UPI0014024D23|nr:tripartite motif-containing protein 66-like isoform X2 [Amblyraja radiata]
MDQSGIHDIANNPAENTSNSAEDDLFRTCLVCKRDLTNREPRLLPCLHSFCKDCVPAGSRNHSPPSPVGQEDSSREGIICCPACRQTCYTGDVVDNVFIREYPPESLNMDTCSACENKPAFKFCSDCSKWLCSACSEEHLHGTDTKHHKLLTSEHAAGDESEVNKFSLVCPLHTNEPLKLFCETCDILVCWTCQLTQHKEHSFKYLEDVLQNQKVTLEELTLKMEEKRIKMQNSAKQAQDRLNELMQVRMKVENQIKMAKMAMLSELNKRMNVLMDQVERITNERRLKLEHRLQTVMGLCRNLEHVLNFHNWAVARKNNIPFIFSKELILFQMHRILETECNTDLGHSKIHFHWDSVLWTNKLSALGHLSFDSENSTLQECQSSFHQQPSVPSGTADHRPCLPPSLLCQSPGQQYSVCRNHCTDTCTIQKDHRIASSFQNHQTVGQMVESMQHPLQVQYSGMQQKQSQQKYFTCPFPEQPIQPWHAAQTGPEQCTVLAGHLQTQHLQPRLHSASTAPQQGSMTPMHLVTLQQPKHLVHRPQKTQHFQMQHVQLSNQTSVQPFTMKRLLPPEQIQQQFSFIKSQGKHPSKETGQQSQPEQMPIKVLQQVHQFHQAPQNIQTALREFVRKKQNILVEDSGQQRAMLNNQARQREQNQVPQFNVVNQVACSISSQIESTIPVHKETLQPDPLLVELHAPPIVPRTHHMLPENIPVNLEAKKKKYKLEGSDTRVPKESMETESDPFKEHSCKEPITLSDENPRVNESPDLIMNSPDESPCDKANPRAQMDGVKVPYVRLDRLELSAPSTDQLPIFKVQSTVDEDESKHLLTKDSQTSCIATRNIDLDSALTPPNSNPPPPQQSELEDAPVTSDLPPDVAAFPSPLDEKSSEENSQTASNAADATDDNEDYCAVCLNGGELLCCDRCPKVFHLGCHVPSLLSFPMGEWLCTLCRNVVMPEVEYDCENIRHINEYRGIRTFQGLSIGDQRKCEKLTLHLYCYPLSLPFHEPVSPLARHYYQIIKRPMDLSTVRVKLQKKNPLHYYTPEEFISDIQLMFLNCAKFNYPDSEVAQAGKSLETYFDEKLQDIYPDKSFTGTTQEYSDYEEIDNEAGTVTINGFNWPTEEKEPVKSKKRRRHGANHSHKDHK